MAFYMLHKQGLVQLRPSDDYTEDALGDGEGSVAAMTAQRPLQHFQCGGDIFKPWLDTNATVLVWSANRRVATALAGVPHEPGNEMYPANPNPIPLN